ncbi:unnamed protein product [Angiostrongylus costaricensis]|uniref:VWFA domain-containing protein n=1 Tax=Angiostrongylus costaricensis TaxID=334426 RepID=A0A0R3PXC3_ANGCS|nr:unnamed protein product [Angiostrongylus costaricensis]
MKLKLTLFPLSMIFASISTTQQNGENCTPILDLGFILDTSGSIEEIYNEHVRWTVALVEILPISKQAVRVSTIQYAGYPLTEFSLDTYNSKSDVVKHLQEMSFQSGVTRTGFALRRAEDEIFNENRGARKNAAKIIALFTDGLSIDDPIKASDHLRHKKGVKIYVISVSAEGFVPEMQRIAGENANVYGFSQDNAIPPSEVIRSMANVEFYVVILSQCSNRNYLRQIVKDEEKVLMHEDASFFGNHLKSRLNCEN